MRYARTFAKEDTRVWGYMFDHNESPLLKKGDRVKIIGPLIDTKLFSVLGDNVHIVDEIRPVTNWKWLPFQQFIGLSGNSEDLFYNTVLRKI